MDRDRFREALQQLREQLVGSQAALSARTKKDRGGKGVNTMTISAIERGATVNPGLFTVARLVEAMPGLTLSSFFARIEGLQPQPLASTTTAPSAESEQADHAAPPLASSPSVHDLEAFGRAFGRSIVEEFRRDSERKTQSRASEKPKRRARARSDARRRG